MKTMIAVCLALVAPTLFVSAAVWEGAATAVSGGELAGEVYSIATNSFPRNTVVDVTNLENNRSVRVLVVANLNSVGLLATLSRGAADSIGMNGNSVRRVRITQPSDSIAFAHIRRGPLPALTEIAEPETGGAPADPSSETGDAEPERVSAVPAGDEPAFVAHWGSGAAEPEAENAPAVPAYAETETAVTEALDAGPETAVAESPVPDAPETPAFAEAFTPAEDRALAEIPEERFADADRFYATRAPDSGPSRMEPIPHSHLRTADAVPNDAPVVAVAPVLGEIIPAISRPAPPARIISHEPRIYIPFLAPAEERLPPAREVVIAREHIIPPIERSPVVTAENLGALEEARTVEPPGAGTQTAAVETPPNFSPFGVAPERNAWYVQLGAFTHSGSAEEEVDRIQRSYPYPVVVRNAGTEANPVFRVLLGPMNQGESAAVLRRVRSVGHTDAFLRRAN